jgi:Kelch motif/Galactose oxidase, central domain
VNGQVLIVGGILQYRPPVGTGTAEIYDPNTELFLPTNPIVGTTSYHTATLLSDSRVLVTGGRGFGPFETGQLSSAQVYNSTSGIWTLVGRMIVPREGHTATRLQNGQVLIAGGDTTHEITVNSAELFNPATNTFSLTGSMHQARNEQGVALLFNGQVLVAGGSGNPNIPRLASAELYNPLNGTWTDTSSMHVPRDNYTAILLPNGKVLAAGGVASDTDPPALEASAELYEPSVDAPPACELAKASPTRSCSLRRGSPKTSLSTALAMGTRVPMQCSKGQR